MFSKTSSIGAVMLLGVLALGTTGAIADDGAKYPDWGGQWARPRGVGIQWDQDKRPGLPQQAPLTPEYQAKLEASLADQRAGGQGLDNRYTCMTNGMPRMMALIEPVEFIILPSITYVLFEAFMPRRIYTDGRAFPTNEEPSFQGYAVGQWLDTDGDGRFDTLEVETRHFKGPRAFEPSGMPLHEDNQTVIKERIYLDKANPDLLHDDMTVFDNALTRPWTVAKKYRRDNAEYPIWPEDICPEGNGLVFIGNEMYFQSGEGLLMPAKKGQEPPDLRYFKQTQK